MMIIHTFIIVADDIDSPWALVCVPEMASLSLQWKSGQDLICELNRFIEAEEGGKQETNANNIRPALSLPQTMRLKLLQDFDDEPHRK